MGRIVVTGSASGMGAAVTERLRSQGDEVIGVDLRDAEVTEDLSTPEGRARAIDRVLELSEGVLDGAVFAAGLGPGPGKERPRQILQVNYYGTVDLLTGWHSALASGANAKVVVFSSNSTTTMPAVPGGAIRALLQDNLPGALRRVQIFGKQASAFAYGASKIAVTQWMRTQAVLPAWAGQGIRMNAIAPGAILTPLLQAQLAQPDLAKAVESFPVPTGGYGSPEEIAEWVVFMLGDAAGFLCGTVVTVDGGSDAWFRARDWPKAVPLRHTLKYLRRMKAFRK